MVASSPLLGSVSGWKHKCTGRCVTFDKFAIMRPLLAGMCTGRKSTVRIETPVRRA
jgi:hypothetical protein